jgi:hypothetical protein
MFPKIRQVAKETFMPKKAAAERGARIDAQRGYGTYNPLAGADRPSVPGFPNVRNTRQNYERMVRSGDQIAKHTGGKNPVKDMGHVPGIGL